MDSVVMPHFTQVTMGALKNIFEIVTNKGLIRFVHNVLIVLEW